MTTALTVYIDIDTTHGRAIEANVAASPTTATSDRVAHIVEDWPLADEEGVDLRVAEDVVRHLNAPSGRDAVHPYVRAALSVVSQRLPERVTLTDVAEQINVSVPHLSRLWRQDLGISFQTWVRWTRLRAAASLLSAGASITDAAHSAGFADGAHASRVCRDMFGLSPLEVPQGVTVI